MLTNSVPIRYLKELYLFLLKALNVNRMGSISGKGGTCCFYPEKPVPLTIEALTGHSISRDNL
jgi:hypothetical protein